MMWYNAGTGAGGIAEQQPDGKTSGDRTEPVQGEACRHPIRLPWANKCAIIWLWQMTGN